MTLGNVNLSVDGGANASFPGLTTYTVPVGANVGWTVQHNGSVLSFPNLTTITGPSTPNSYLNLTAQYLDGQPTAPLLFLPALTTITKPDDGDPYPNSGVSLVAYASGVISAPALTTFNDNDSHPNSGLSASIGGVLSAPNLVAPKGVNINLNALSHPERFTSLVGTSSFEINDGTVTMSNLASITGFSSIVVDNGGQLSFPNVTSYTLPPGANVGWTVQHNGSVLSFPNLATITGPSTPNSYFNLTAQYLDGQPTAPLLFLPALTTITKPDDGDPYPNSGVSLVAYASGVISAPALTTFNDNDSHPNSGLSASIGGVLSAPNLVAPKGVNINLNALSHPERFTSLVGTSSFEINDGTVTMSNLASITGFSSIVVDNGGQLSFPNVTSYTLPPGANVGWTVQHNGSVLSFPNLTTITGPSTPNSYLNLTAQYLDGQPTAPLLSLPALTTITKPDDGDPYPNSGVSLVAYASGVISAPALTTFNDNDSHPNSGLSASIGGVLSAPNLMAPKGVNINLNALSHPERFTSLVGTSSFELNDGTVSMSNLASITGFSSIVVDNGGQLSFPNVTSYTLPPGGNVGWTVLHNGSVLSFPNLTTITGPSTPNSYLNLTAQYLDGQPTAPLLSLPALTTITKPDDGDPYPNSGVSLVAYASGVISAPALTTFNDNDSHPNSSISASVGGFFSADQLMSVIGVNVNLGYALTVPSGQNYVGYGSLQFGVFNDGLFGISAPGRTLAVNGPLSSTGTVKITNGSTLSINGNFILDGMALLNLASGSTLSVTGDFLGTTTNTSGPDPEGNLLLNGSRTAVDPQHLEAMSKDMGAVAAGFTNNFAFGSVSLANGTYVQVVDRSHNTTSTAKECIYANSVVIPVGCTLDLNGFSFYARAVQLAGTVKNGSITQIPNAGTLTLGTPTPGALSAPGQLDEWTFFARGSRSLSVVVNPGTSVNPAPIAPQLLWASASLIDPNGTVLRSASNANAGDLVQLTNVPLTVDGTYKIHINAPAIQTAATGNYILGAYDATPNVRSLTLGQQVTGNIGAAYGVDQWNFSAGSGQQVRLQANGNSASGIAFALTGPNGYVAFQDISGMASPLVDLAASGNYTLSVYGLNGATGGYSFNLAPTSVTPLALGTPYTGTWAGSGQAQLFTVPVTTANPLSVILTDAAMADHTEIYVRFNAAPTREIFDLAASGTGSSHNLLVPSATVGTWYILVYSESVSGGGDYTLQANSGEVVLSRNSTSQSAANFDTTITLTGAGFNSGTKVSLVSANGTVYDAVSSTTDLPTQITATFTAGTVPAGTYTIRVTQQDGFTSELPSSITISATGQGVLTTHIDIPDPIGLHIASTFYVSYSNTGNAPMPAPLLNIYGTNPNGLQGAFLTLDPALITQGFWTSATPLGYSHSVQILASGDTPGILQPGETKRVPLYYGGWESDQWDARSRFNFFVVPTHADDATPVDWTAYESLTKPTSISSAAWHIIYANLVSQLGATSGGYVQLLDKNATYLGQLGENVTDIGKLWNFAIMQALNVFPTESVGSTVDGSLPSVGRLSLSLGRTFRNSIPGRFQTGPFGLGWITPWQRSLSVATDGTVTLSISGGGKSIYLPDGRSAGRYFSQAGDYSTFAAVTGGYQLTAPDGTISVFQANGNLNYLSDTCGNKITAAYTGNNLIKLTASSGQSLTLAYNGGGLISSLTDSAGRVTSYTYDGTNQHLISVTGFDGRVTLYAYNTTTGSPASNALTSITFPDGRVQNLTYGNHGLLAGATANGGALSKMLAYSTGRVNITDATAATSSLSFDENGQLAKTVDALGNPTFYRHDSDYSLSSITDAVGISATYAHNSSGEVTSMTDNLGNTTNFVYGGPQNQLTKLTDANGNPTTYSYNTTGQRTGTVFANGSSESSTFDSRGNAVSFVNASGEPIQYAHNSAGQLTNASFPDGSSYAYFYGDRGQLVSATDTNGSVIFTYDPVTGFLAKVAYPNGLSLTFGYDSGGRRTSMTDQAGFTTNYAYDSVGRLSMIEDGGGNTIVTYVYDIAGRLSKKTTGNGTYTTYEYDANGHVLHLINYERDSTINSRFDDTYNVLGLKTAEATLDGIWTYAYDADGQLRHAVFASNNPAGFPNQDLTYNYDAMGNRISAIINGATTIYVTNDMNQYVSVGGCALSYDTNGNLIKNSNAIYTYDFLNRLVSFSDTSNAVSFTYDALGQRSSSSNNGTVESYLYDPLFGGRLVGEYSTAEVAIASYVNGLGLAEMRRNNEWYAYTFDTLGNSVGIADENGVTSNLQRYSPFGERMDTSATVLNQCYYDGVDGVRELGPQVYAAGARVYQAKLGRFSSRDPIGLLGGDTNLQRYARNNPIKFIDPSGTISVLNILKTGSVIAQLLNPFDSDVPIELANPSENLAEIGRTIFEEEEGAASLEAGLLAIPAAIFAGDYYLYEHPGEVESWLITHVPDSVFDAINNLLDGNPGGDGGNGDGGGGGSGSGGGNGGGSGGGGWGGGGGGLGGGGSGGGGGGSGGSGGGAGSHDPNALYGPAGYGAANFVTNLGNTFGYRITFENDAAATAPAQSVTIGNSLDARLDWSTFQLTGIGFGDSNFVIPPGSQHYQTTVSMTYNGQTFNVQIEAGINSDTGQVYATFQSVDPNTSLPPANVLTGFLPPENGTGRGDGYLTYSVSPKAGLATGVVIPNVASIVFDAGQAITTNQVDPHDASKGTDTAKEARVTIDGAAPVSDVAALPTQSPANFWVHWLGTDDASGLATYSIYFSDDGGNTWAPWLLNTTSTAAIFYGQSGMHYAFYSTAADHAGNVESKSAADATTDTLPGSLFQGTVVVAKNDPAPGVTNGKFLLADTPAVDANGDVIFKGYIGGTTKDAGISSGNNSGIWSFNGSVGALLARTGIHPASDQTATLASVSDPAVAADGSVAFAAGLKGGDVKKDGSNANEIWLISGSTTSVAVRAGDGAADQAGATYRSFAQIVTEQPNDAAFLATITPANGRHGSNFGLWGADLTGALHSIVTVGESMNIGGGLRKITGINVFSTPTRERGQSRSVDTQDGRLTFGLGFGRDAAICVATPSQTEFNLEDVADTWETTVAGVPNAKYASFGSPAVNATGTVAFRAVLSSTSPATKISAANRTGIWRDVASSTSLIARTGFPAVGTNSALYATLEEPVLNNDGQIAFIGSLHPAKNQATAATAEGIWSDSGGTLALIARTGNAAADVPGGKFSEFEQLVLPDGSGPIFLAKLKGVKQNANTGLWSVGPDGQIHLIVQTGELVDVRGTMKNIESFQIFKVCPLVVGQSRNFDATTRGVVFQATFTDGSWAILQTYAP